jgi:hypothetical protein
MGCRSFAPHLYQVRSLALHRSQSRSDNIYSVFLNRLSSYIADVYLSEMDGRISVSETFYVNTNKPPPVEVWQLKDGAKKRFGLKAQLEGNSMPSHSRTCMFLTRIALF